MKQKCLENRVWRRWSQTSTRIYTCKMFLFHKHGCVQRSTDFTRVRPFITVLRRQASSGTLRTNSCLKSFEVFFGLSPSSCTYIAVHISPAIVLYRVFLDYPQFRFSGGFQYDTAVFIDVESNVYGFFLILRPIHFHAFYFCLVYGLYRLQAY